MHFLFTAISITCKLCIIDSLLTNWLNIKNGTMQDSQIYILSTSLSNYNNYQCFRHNNLFHCYQ